MLESNSFSGLTERMFVLGLRQFSRYLQEPSLRRAIRQRVEDVVGSSTHVIVAHNLGSIVAYEALCAHPEWNVKLFVTLGSPLGMRNVIFNRLEPAPQNGIGSWPGSVERWVNIADQNDVLAVPRSLQPLFAGPVEDIRVDIDSQAFSASDYLTAAVTAGTIATGLAD